MPSEYEGKNTLVVYYYNDSTSQYEKINTVSFSEDKKSLIVKVKHFSNYFIADSSEVQTFGETTSNETETTTNTVNSTTSTSPFVDIRNHWGKSFIEKLYADGIIKGRTSTIFAPDAQITRAEITKIIIGAFDISTSSVSQNPFVDVDKNQWYATYIQAAKNSGIVDSTKRNFRPNDPVSRAEAVKMIFSAAGSTLPQNSRLTFSDTNSNLWYAPFVSLAVEKGIVKGYAGNLFKPADSITRAEASKIILKATEL